MRIIYSKYRIGYGEVQIPLQINFLTDVEKIFHIRAKALLHI